jgi:hypothetical protein
MTGEERREKNSRLRNENDRKTRTQIMKHALVSIIHDEITMEGGRQILIIRTSWLKVRGPLSLVFGKNKENGKEIYLEMLISFPFVFVLERKVKGNGEKKEKKREDQKRVCKDCGWTIVDGNLSIPKYIYSLLCHPLVFVFLCVLDGFFFFFSFGWPDNWCGVSLLAEEVILERRTLGNSHLVFSLFLRVIDTWQLIVWGKVVKIVILTRHGKPFTNSDRKIVKS